MHEHLPAAVASPSKIYSSYFAEHARLVPAVQAACAPALDALAQACLKALRSGGKILFFGNGGSAADAQHLATELSVRFIRDRRALAGLALTTDSSVLTACGNDLGFEAIFARQIEALGRAGDVAVGFSTSGNSPNVIRALATARQMQIVSAAFTGDSGGKLKEIADPIVMVPSRVTAHIQEMHILLGHVLCAEIEHGLGLAHL